jgi:hypothetical protein
MNRWVLRSVGVVALGAAILKSSDLAFFIQVNLRAGWTLWPPGLYERVVTNSLMAVVGFIAAAVLFGLSFRRRPD